MDILIIVRYISPFIGVSLLLKEVVSLMRCSDVNMECIAIPWRTISLIVFSISNMTNCISSFSTLLYMVFDYLKTMERLILLILQRWFRNWGKRILCIPMHADKYFIPYTVRLEATNWIIYLSNDKCSFWIYMNHWFSLCLRKPISIIYPYIIESPIVVSSQNIS